MITKSDIFKMYESGYSSEEMAENLSEFDCIGEIIGEMPKWCHDDADCHDCWIKSVDLILDKEVK